MEIKLAFGNKFKKANIDVHNVIEQLKLQNIPKISLEKESLKSFKTPIASNSLSKLIEEKTEINSLVIIVSDNTRAFPYPKFLPILTNFLLSNGIKKNTIHFIIATGTHRPMTNEEIQIHYGKEIVKNFSFHNHNCKAKNLVYKGDFSSGTKFYINKNVAEADFVITTGILNTHYLAGFSAGRKAILPGISDYETIRRNHSLVKDENVALAKMNKNPIHLEMMEAILLQKVDFNINFVLNQNKEIAAIFAGNIENSFLEGTNFIRKFYSVSYSKIADVVITSAGGFPKDRTFYHTQKCLNNVIDLVKDGGTIIVVSSCQEGIGSSEMERYFTEKPSIDSILDIDSQKISIGGHRAIATAKLLKKVEIILISEMNKKMVELFHFSYAENLQSAISKVSKKYGKNFTSYIIPNGSFFFGVNCE